MNARHPKIRIHSRRDHFYIRDSLSLTFFMRCPHVQIATQILRSLDRYLESTHARLMHCIHHDEHSFTWAPVDDDAWSRFRQELRESNGANLDLHDESTDERRHAIEYLGGPLESESFPELGSALRLWLPTEYLKEHGPRRVRELALELLGPLPICSGDVGLAFHGSWELTLQRSQLTRLAFQYPGMDIPESLGSLSIELRTRLRGISWMTLLGQPALGEVGGVAGLRARLRSPETTIEELPGDRAVITLGEWPDSGDTHKGRLLPSYRELAQVLEPILYREEREHWQALFDSPEELRRWQRRFLD